MKATVVDFRYRMNDVLKALDRNEDVALLFRGKKKGVLTAHPNRAGTKVTAHPFFNMRPSDRSVKAEMETLRGGRGDVGPRRQESFSHLGRSQQSAPRSGGARIGKPGAAEQSRAYSA